MICLPGTDSDMPSRGRGSCVTPAMGDDVAEHVRLGGLLLEESQGGRCRMASLPEEWGVLYECRDAAPLWQVD